VKLEQVIELDDGSIEFKGELSPAEVKLVVEVGMNFLVRSGAFNALQTKAIKESLN
jgi:hypothetical protein